MRVVVYLPLLLTALFGALAPRLARRLPPRPATWLLSGGGMTAAATCGMSLLLLAFTWVAQDPLLASRGRWSNRVLTAADPVRAPVAMLAGAAAAAVLTRLAVVGYRRLRAVRAAYRLAGALPAHGGELAVVDSPRPEACAVPGRPGRIVVSTALLRALPADQRRAVLAHERAHLRQRHYLHHAAAALAATNPLLRRLPAAVGVSCERWADESAATTAGRRAVADALASTAAAGLAAARASSVVLAAATTAVHIRIAALHSPAPRLTLWRIGLLLAVLLAGAAAVLEAAHDTERLFELAQAAGHAARR